MATAIWNKFMESHDYVMSLGDPRTQDWLLVKSPLYPLAFLVMFYMPLVMHGPKIMAFFKPIEAKRALFAFNVFQIMFSTFMWTQFLYLAVSMNYSLKCEPVGNSSDPLQMRMAACIWYFYISKIIDLIDTLWFVLRKKDRNISFLHVYHHSTQVFIWWIGVKFVPGGQSFFIGFINSMVHSVMYTYYLIASLGDKYKKFLWWKKYLTGVQMIQFIMVLAHSVAPLVTPGCKFPAVLSLISTGYTVSVFGLFLNFYIVNYVRQQKPAGKSSSVKANGSTTHLVTNNGTSHPCVSNGNGHTVSNGTEHRAGGAELVNGVGDNVRKRDVKVVSILENADAVAGLGWRSKDGR